MKSVLLSLGYISLTIAAVPNNPSLLLFQGSMSKAIASAPSPAVPFREPSKNPADTSGARQDSISNEPLLTKTTNSEGVLLTVAATSSSCLILIVICACILLYVRGQRMSPSATIKEDLTRGGLSDSFGLSIISCYDSDNESPEMQDTGSATRLARPESRHVALPSAQLPKFKLIDYRVFTPELVGTAPPITPGNSYQYRITANALQHANN